MKPTLAVSVGGERRTKMAAAPGFTPVSQWAERGVVAGQVVVWRTTVLQYQPPFVLIIALSFSIRIQLPNLILASSVESQNYRIFTSFVPVIFKCDCDHSYTIGRMLDPASKHLWSFHFYTSVNTSKHPRHFTNSVTN